MPEGEKTQCFDVFINDDAIYEQSEKFSLTLRPLESAHVELSNSTTIIELLDNEGNYSVT